jgi:hypothetical protein
VPVTVVKWRWVLLAVLAAGWLTACGDGTASITVTTEPGSTSSVPPTVTTTTVATTTTTPAAEDTHPAWPVSWAALWPADGSTATARATTDEGTIDAEVGMDYGVAWDGGTWDRIWLGSPQSGQLGVSFYLQRPEPWVVVLWGAHTYGPAGFDMKERFDPPPTLDLRRLFEEAVSGETTLVITDFNAAPTRGLTP